MAPPSSSARRSSRRPSSRTTPSAALSGLVLSLRGAAASDAGLAASARKLGALLAELTDGGVTHVVSEASEVGAPPRAYTVVPDWLRACAEAGKRVDETEYLVPVLSGLEVVPSGISVSEKTEVQRVVERLGGRFTRALERNCTHLITPVANGKKYEFAEKRKDIAIITPRWLFDCAAVRRRLDERRYHPAKPAPPAIQDEVEADEAPPAAETEPDAEAVADVDGEAEPVPEDEDREEGNEDEHLLPTRGSLDAGGRPKKKAGSSSSRASLKGVSPKATGRRRSRSVTPAKKKASATDASPSRSPAADAGADSPDKPAPAADLAPVPAPRPKSRPRVTLNSAHAKPDARRQFGRSRRPRTRPPSLLLDVLSIYLTSSPSWNSSKHGPQRARALRLAAGAGAAVSPRWAPSVNTVVVVSLPVPPEEAASVAAAEARGARVVGLAWLEQCVSSGKLLPATAVAVPDWRASAASPDATTAGFGFPFGGRGDAGAAQPTSRIFHGGRFSLGPLALRDANAAAGVAQEFALGCGKVLPHAATGLTTAGVPTHIVCPTTLSEAETAVVEATRVHHRNVILVTQRWAQACIDEKCLLPVRLCALFSPVASVPVPGMQEINVSISGFQQVPAATDWNRRRTTLAELVQLLGGSVHDGLQRRATSVVICDDAPPVSNKIISARKWKIPVVSHAWILACASKGAVLPFDGFPLKLAARPRSGRGRPPQKPKRPAHVPINASQIGPTQIGPTQAPASQFVGTQATQTATEMPDPNTISLFNKFTSSMRRANSTDPAKDEGLNAAGANAMEDLRRSRSVSREEWDEVDPLPGSASQSQVIVHRDLTPPPSPKHGLRRSRRNLPPGASRAKRARVDS